MRLFLANAKPDKSELRNHVLDHLLEVFLRAGHKDDVVCVTNCWCPETVQLVAITVLAPSELQSSQNHLGDHNEYKRRFWCALRQPPLQANIV